MKSRILVWIFSLMLFSIASLANPRFEAKLSSSKVPLNKQLIITYTFTDDYEDIQLPQLNDFRFVGQSQSWNSSGIRELSLTFIPTKKGNFTIPGATAKGPDGKLVRLNTLQVEVIDAEANRVANKNRGANSIQDFPYDDFDIRMMEQEIEMMALFYQNDEHALQQLRERKKKLDDYKIAYQKYKKEHGLQGGSRSLFPSFWDDMDYGPENLQDRVFVEASPSKKVAYVGESIDVVFYLYTMESFQNGQYAELPQFKGFLSKEYEIPKDAPITTVNRNGHTYHVRELKRAVLYPTEVGNLKIDGLSLELVSPRFGQFKVTSRPVTIVSKPLPKPQPDNFSGGVGKYALQVNLPINKLTTNDMLPLQVMVKGVGNIDMLTAPKIINKNDSIIWSEPISSLSDNKFDIKMGSKTFTYNLSFAEPGNYTIPGIEYVYFDIDKQQYITLTSEPTSIEVTLGDIEPIVDNDSTTRPQMVNNNVLPSIDYRNIWFTNWTYWGIMVLLSGVVIAVDRSKNKQPLIPVNKKLIKAQKVALKRLEKAKSVINNEDKNIFYQEVSKAIWLYLADKLHIPMAELSKNNIELKLSEKLIPQDMISDTIERITACEMELYSPMSSPLAKENMLQDVTNLIVKYESLLDK